jgi:hypothetical protein
MVGRRARRLRANEGDPLYAAYVLVLVLGLGQGEAVGLSWHDIDVGLTIGLQLQWVARQLLHRETKTAAADATEISSFRATREALKRPG